MSGRTFPEPLLAAQISQAHENLWGVKEEGKGPTPAPGLQPEDHRGALATGGHERGWHCQPACSLAVPPEPGLGPPLHSRC